MGKASDRKAQYVISIKDTGIGMNAHVAKPIDVEALLKAVSKCIS